MVLFSVVALFIDTATQTFCLVGFFNIIRDQFVICRGLLVSYAFAEIEQMQAGQFVCRRGGNCFKIVIGTDCVTAFIT